jgi:transcriptional regulator GlxA family with amidase domain
MKTTVTSHSFVEAFRAAGRESQFTRAALFALFDYLESYEEDCGVEIELDPIAICCEWAEYESAVEAAESYGREFSDESDALDWLREQTQVIEFQSGFLIQQF